MLPRVPATTDVYMQPLLACWMSLENAMSLAAVLRRQGKGRQQLDNCSGVIRRHAAEIPARMAEVRAGMP